MTLPPAPAGGGFQSDKDIPMALADYPKRVVESPEFVRGYVSFMMGFMGRGIVALSQVDQPTRNEIAGFPEGFSFQMKSLPEGPSLALRKTDRNELKLLELAGKRPTISIEFKHLRHAFRVLTFQESTAQGFANDRMIVDGEIAYAMRMVRILNRFQALALPPAIAQKALKRVPEIPAAEKQELLPRLFARLAINEIRNG